MSTLGRRPPFREQTVGSILLRMARSMLAPAPMRKPHAARQGMPVTGSEGAPTPGPRSAALPLPLMLLALAAVVAVCAVVLARIIGASPAPAAPAPLAPAAAPTSPSAPSGVSPTPAPLLAPAGAPLTVVRTYGAVPGSAPLFQQPREAVLGPDGLLYVADTGNHRIAVVDAHGTVVRTITRGNAGPLQSPFAVAIAPNGHLVVLDSDLGQVLAYATRRDASAAPLAASALSLSLGHARDLVLDATGQILVADPASNSVVTLSSDLALVHQQPNRATDGTQLYEQPDAIALGPNGSVYVVDSQNNQVKQFSSQWRLLRSLPIVTTDTMHAPHLLALPGDRLLVSDPPDDKLLLFSPGSDTPQAFSVPTQGGLPAQPLGLARGTNGAILVTCATANQVLEVRLPGVR